MDLAERQHVADGNSVSPCQRKSYIACPGRQWWYARRVGADELPQYEHWQPNTARYVNYLVVDIDTAQAALVAHDLDFQPNFIVCGANGHGHAYWRLARPVALNDPMVIKYVEDIQRRLAQAIEGADPNFVALWAKNPYHPGWRTQCFHDRTWALGDLSKHLPSLRYEHAHIDWGEATFEPGSRNADLFHTLRRWAYEQVECDRHSAAEFQVIVLRQAEDLVRTMMSVPLPHSEVKSVAKSVADWTLKHRPRKRRSAAWNIGALGPRGDTPWREWLQRAQAHMAQIITERNATIVLDARAQHPAATKSEVARITGLSRPTVHKYWASDAAAPCRTATRLGHRSLRSARPDGALRSEPCAQERIVPFRTRLMLDAMRSAFRADTSPAPGATVPPPQPEQCVKSAIRVDGDSPFYFADQSPERPKLPKRRQAPRRRKKLTKRPFDPERTPYRMWFLKQYVEDLRCYTPYEILCEFPDIPWAFARKLAGERDAPSG